MKSIINLINTMPVYMIPITTDIKPITIDKSCQKGFFFFI